MKIGFVQTDPEFGAVEKNRSRVEALLGNAAADLMVFPELFNTGYQFNSREEALQLAEPIPGGPTTEWLIRLARSLNTLLIAGVAERDGATLYNSAVAAGPEGYLGTYRKAHIFDTENDLFQPGNLDLPVYEHPVKSVPGGVVRVGVMICFDWRFPETARTLALRGADIIAHPANLVLPHCPQAMITRCLENRVYAVTADRSGREDRVPGQAPLEFIGQSQVVGPGGEVLYRASEAGEETRVVEIDVARARDKTINTRNDLLKGRRTDLYQM